MSTLQTAILGELQPLLASIMNRAEGNQTQAADMLGMNRNTLRAKIRKFNIDVGRYR